MAYRWSVPLALAGAGLLLWAGDARAAETVVGGGAAKACSQAAFKGKADWRAEDVCTRALDTELLDPHDQAGTYVNRGVLRLQAGAYGPAARDFDAAEHAMPGLGETHVNRAILFLAQDRYAEAVDEINKGLDLGVENPAHAYYNRAQAYEGLNDPRAAYEDYRRAQELAPSWGAPSRMLARFSVRTRETGS